MGSEVSGAPTSIDPELVAAVVRLLSVRGPLGALLVSDVIVPTISLGETSPRTVIARSPAFRSGDVFTSGILTGPVINTVLADTGALPAGTYDVMVGIQTTQNDRLTSMQLQHRNPANAANIVTWDHNLHAGSDVACVLPFYGFGYELALNERLRILNTVAVAAGRTVAATILARIRE